MNKIVLITARDFISLNVNIKLAINIVNIML